MYKKSERTLIKNAVTKVTSLSNSSLAVSHRPVCLVPTAISHELNSTSSVLMSYKKI